MVNPDRPSASRDRLLAAARAEFAARGFDGAKVDRIAQRARVNKAMLYYHFRSKAALYLDVLRTEFGAIGDAVTAVREGGAPPAEQLAAFVAATAAAIAERPHLPPIWLRELAEGGRHLDETIVAQLRRVVGTLAAILAEGRRSGGFGPANPLLVQISIVAPLMLFAASAPLRARLGHAMPAEGGRVGPEDAWRHVQASMLALVSGAGTSGRPSAAAVRRPVRTSVRRSATR